MPIDFPSNTKIFYFARQEEAHQHSFKMYIKWHQPLLRRKQKGSQESEEIFTCIFTIFQTLPEN